MILCRRFGRRIDAAQDISAVAKPRPELAWMCRQSGVIDVNDIRLPPMDERLRGAISVPGMISIRFPAVEFAP